MPEAAEGLSAVWAGGQCVELLGRGLSPSLGCLAGVSASGERGDSVYSRCLGVLGKRGAVSRLGISSWGCWGGGRWAAKELQGPGGRAWGRGGCRGGLGGVRRGE